MSLKEPLPSVLETLECMLLVIREIQMLGLPMAIRGNRQMMQVLGGLALASCQGILLAKVQI